MMSNPINHYGSSYPQSNSTPLSQHRNGFSGHQNMPLAGLDVLAESSQYALEQLHNPSVSNHYLNINRSPLQQRSHSFGMDDEPLHRQRSNSTHDSRGIKKSSQAPVRRRISRACDQCNQLRTKCDGKSPCAHCVEFNLSCEYARERKKRGKASKKDIAAAQAAAAAVRSGTAKAEDGATSPGGRSSSRESPPPALNEFPMIEKTMSAPTEKRDKMPTASRSASMNEASKSDLQILRRQSNQVNRANSFGAVTELPPMHGGYDQSNTNDNVQQPYDTPMAGMGINGYPALHGIDRTAMQDNGIGGMPILPPASQGQNMTGMVDTTNFQGFNEANFGMMNAQDQQGMMNGYRYTNPNESPVPAFTGFSPPNPSPGWASLPSPASNGSNPTYPTPPRPSNMKYPVLQPLMPHLSSIIPAPLASELLEAYFASSSASHLRPLSPYVLGYVFRKRSILSQNRYRKCSAALLASMLWIAAQTHDAPFLTAPPAARGRVCQKLLELTIALLKPLVHGPASGETSPNYASTMVINGVALGGFGVSIDQVSAEASATGAIDDVATYIHLATVVSASEYKAASLRWWNAAWSLARELKLGRELPPNPPSAGGLGDDAMDTNPTSQIDGQHLLDGQNAPVIYTEEEREERRRIWWLLYTMDRHLALCYNRPLFLRDKECEGLLQPMSDGIWQAGEFLKTDLLSTKYRRRGPNFECSGHSIFGYFLPLMSILGEIIDLNNARTDPRFGLASRDPEEWAPYIQEIANQLDIYGRSLKEFEIQCNNKLAAAAAPPDQQQNQQSQDGTGPGTNGSGPPSGPGGVDQSTPSVTSSASQHLTESIYQTRIVIAYGTHIMHVLHILLTGKWDPINLLDDNDLWISSQEFITATSHAVSAAEAVSDILEYDPDLSFMPFFVGVYLLQGSFLLLLIADKLKGDASESVVGACETIVRAHEACVVTLNTEYQRNFRKVMRSALMQVKGRVPEDFGEQQQRRREVLALYRWTGDGTGLAL